MPDLLSLGLGGGTIIENDPLTIGPQSVGNRITREALVFGGGRLTATDVAVAAGNVELGDSKRAADLDPNLIDACLVRISGTIVEGIDRMKTDAAPLPLIAVGGGAFLVPQELPGISEVIHLNEAPVANAVGAAIAQVSGEVDQVFSGLDRDEAIERATDLAKRRARQAGADESAMSVVDVEDLPIAYLPGDARRVRVRVVGDADCINSGRPRT